MGAIFNCLQLASTMDTIREGIYWLFLSIDAIIYTFINFLFKLFLTLANANIFSESSMNDFIYRIYQLIGVIMLFMLSYAILRKIVNPDSKDKESMGKIIFNVVKAVILLAIVPSIFTYAFKIQDAVLKQNTIGKLILGTSGVNTMDGNETPREVINRGGTTMAQGVFEAFLFPTQGDRNVEVMDGLTYEQLSEEVQQSGNFSAYKNVTDKIIDGTLTYYFFVCFIAGLVVAWMMLSYCISLGFRIIKLAFYEIMAPVCIIASILPSQKEMLSRWIKTTLQVFLETFIRIAILYFVIYVLELLKVSFQNGDLFPDSEFILKSLGWVAIIMGLVMFMKSAPDLISKLTGIDSGNMSLGIKDQLAKGGLFTAAAVVGGAAISGIRNGANAARNTKNNYRKLREDAKHKDSRLSKIGSGALLGARGIGSILAGTLSGGIHGYNKDAASWKDVGASIKKGADKATENRENRDEYSEIHGGKIFSRYKKGAATTMKGKDSTGAEKTYTYNTTSRRWEDSDGNMADVVGLTDRKLFGSDGKQIDSEGYVLDDNGKRIREKGVLAGHASYIATRSKGFMGIGQATESMEKEVEALQAVVDGQKKVNNAILDAIKSEATKGKPNINYGGFDASAVKAIQAIVGDINAGKTGLSRDDVISAFQTAFSLTNRGDALAKLEKFEELSGSGELSEERLATAGFTQKALDDYLKAMTDRGMDDLMRGDAYAKFNFSAANTEFDKLQEAITDAMSKAGDVMKNAGYERGETLTVAKLKERNKVEFNADNSMKDSSVKSLQNQISILGQQIEERKREQRRDAGKKSEDSK